MNLLTCASMASQTMKGTSATGKIMAVILPVVVPALAGMFKESKNPFLQGAAIGLGVSKK